MHFRQRACIKVGGIRGAVRTIKRRAARNCSTRRRQHRAIEGIVLRRRHWQATATARSPERWWTPASVVPVSGLEPRWFGAAKTAVPLGGREP